MRARQTDASRPSTTHMRGAPLTRYIRSGHRSVEGWLSPTAIDLIVELARIQDAEKITGPVCEIGVHHGRLLILLHLLTHPPERTACWDLFDQQHENIDRSGRGDRAKLDANLVAHSCAPWLISIITANSLTLTPSDVQAACQGTPRLFSVDGGHTADLTYSDLQLATESIHDRGLIIVDDVFNENWPGVSEGVFRFLGLGDLTVALPLVPVAIGGNKVVFAKSGEAASLYRCLFTLPQERYSVRREERFCGMPVLGISAKDPRGFGARLRKAIHRRVRSRKALH